MPKNNKKAFYDELDRLLLVDGDKELLNVLLVVRIFRKAPVKALVLGIIALKNRQKLPGIKKVHSLIPVCLGQIGKMEQILDITKT